MRKLALLLCLTFAVPVSAVEFNSTYNPAFVEGIAETREAVLLDVACPGSATQCFVLNLAGAGAQSTQAGTGATATGTGCTSIGDGATCSGTDGFAGGRATQALGNHQTVIGAGAVGGGAGGTAGAGCTIYGAGASGSGTANAECVSIGHGAASGSFAVSIGGNNALVSSEGVGVGYGANVGAKGIGIGQQPTVTGSGICLGYVCNSTANIFVAGSSTQPMNIAYFGKGITNSSATGQIISGTGGSGTDNAGGGITLRGGPGTGTARGGSAILATTPSGATGSTANAAVDRYIVSAKAVALTDAATTVFTVTGLGAHVRAGGWLDFSVEASDGTNDQVVSCRTQWAAADTTAGAGGEACAHILDKTCNSALQGVASSGTLAVTVDATTGTDLCNFRVTPTGSLTETVYNVYLTIGKSLPGGTVTPQ